MTQFPNKFRNSVFGPFLAFLAHFPHFGGKKIFSAVSCTTSYGFLQNLEKVNDTIQRKWPDRRMEGQTDPILYDPSGYRQRSSKLNC